jgi:tetratricopeptide (TPR) repeat protein
MAAEDLLIQLGPAVPEGHLVRVLASPAGDGRGVLRGPAAPPEAEEALAAWWRAGTGGRGQGRAREARGVAPLAEGRPSRHLAPREVGQRLFSALFSGEVRELLMASLLQAGQRSPGGLRIRLKIDPRDDPTGLLQRLPWELLCRPETNSFLALNRLTPVLRSLEAPPPAPAAAPLAGSLRIVAVGSAPKDRAPLLVRREIRDLLLAWRDQPRAEVIPVEAADPEALREALLAAPTHVLHFAGHAELDQESGEGVLLFESPGGSARRVTGSELATELTGLPSLRLVVLNACDTGRPGASASLGTFAGVAAALILARIPAVLAMQSPISDAAARAFSNKLYRRLGAGDPVDVATAEARLAIWRRRRRSFEWATPVLFLSGSDGRLFEPPGALRGWNHLGLATLAAGGAGLAALVGLMLFALWTDPPLRELVKLLLGGLAAGLGGLGWLASRLEPGSWKRASEGFGRRRSLQAACGLLAAAAAAAWALLAPDLACTLRCQPLACAPPGIRRVVIDRFQVAAPADDPLTAAWAEESRRVLAEKLRTAPGLQLVWERGLPPDATAAGCIDAVIAGSVRRGAETVLAATVSGPGGRDLGALEVAGEPDPGGETLLDLEGRLAVGILDRLDVEVTPDLLRRLQATPTGSPEALRLNNRGVEAFEAGAPDLAAARFETALSLDPGYPSPLNNLGMLEVERQNYGAAAGRFEAAIGRLPENPTYRFNLGLARDLGGEPALAIAAYERAIGLDPTFARAYNNLGVVLREEGQLERAREVLERGLGFATDPAVEAFLFKNLGRAALDAGEPRRAIGLLRQALDRHADFAEALFYLAEAQAATGDLRASCESWQRYGRLAERDPSAARRAAAQARAGDLRCAEEGSP